MNELYIYAWKKITEDRNEKWLMLPIARKQSKQVVINNISMCRDIIYNECEGITDKIIAVKGNVERILKEYQLFDGTLYNLICHSYQIIENEREQGTTILHVEEKNNGFIDSLFENDSN